MKKPLEFQIEKHNHAYLIMCILSEKKTVYGLLISCFNNTEQYLISGNSEFIDNATKTMTSHLN